MEALLMNFSLVTTSISLGSMGLGGSIPPFIGNFTQVTYLDVSNNSLSGTLPTELGRLTELTTLSLSINELSGSLPSELGMLTKLQQFTFNNNAISGDMFPGIVNLTMLTSLNGDVNQMERVLIPQLVSLLAPEKTFTLKYNPVTPEPCNSNFLDSLALQTSTSVVGRNGVCDDSNAYAGFEYSQIRTNDVVDRPSRPVDFVGVNSTVNSIDVSWTHSAVGDYTGGPIFEELNPYFVGSVFDTPDFDCIEFYFYGPSLDGTPNGIFMVMHWFRLDVYQNNELLSSWCFQYAEASQNNSSILKFEIGNLTAASDYEFTVTPYFLQAYRTANYIGSFIARPVRAQSGIESSRILGRTLDGVPLGKPGNFTASAITSTSATIQWEPPAPELQSGIITTYELELSGVFSNVMLSVPEVSFREALEPETQYSLRTRAATNFGVFGPWSSVFNFTTCPEKTIKKPKEGVDSCVAQFGFVQLSSGESATVVNCVVIDEFIAQGCEQEGATVDTLIVKDGVWRSEATSLDFFYCPLEGGCITETLLVNNRSCAIGYEGPLCGACENGYFQDLRTCVSCRSELTILAVLVTIVLIIGGLVLVSRKKFTSEVLAVVWSYQLVNALPDIVTLPPSAAFLHRLASIATLDIFALLPMLSCISTVHLLNKMLGLLVLLGVLAVVLTIFTKWRGSWMMSGAMWAFNVFFVALNHAAFQALAGCEEYIPGKLFMLNDITVECNSEQYFATTGLAWAVVSVSFIVLVIVSSILVISEKCSRKVPMVKQSSNLKDLLDPFLSPYSTWWYGAYELARRFLFAGWVLVVSQDPRTLTGILLFASLADAALTDYIKPYHSNKQLQLKLSSYAVHGVFVFGFLLSTDGPVGQLKNSTLLDTLMSLLILVPISTLALAVLQRSKASAVDEAVSAKDI